jgi:hypothetical protein
MCYPLCASTSSQAPKKDSRNNHVLYDTPCVCMIVYLCMGMYIMCVCLCATRVLDIFGCRMHLSCVA